MAKKNPPIDSICSECPLLARLQKRLREVEVQRNEALIDAAKARAALWKTVEGMP